MLHLFSTHVMLSPRNHDVHTSSMTDEAGRQGERSLSNGYVINGTTDGRGRGSRQRLCLHYYHPSTPTYMEKEEAKTTTTTTRGSLLQQAQHAA